MAQSPAGTTSPYSLRVIESTPGESLTVALPLPSDASALQESSPSSTMNLATALPEPDRTWWTRLSYSPGLLQIGTVLRHLGLRQVPNAKRIVFQYNNVIQLADAVAEVIKKLPTDQEGLIDIAANFKTGVLDGDIALLLHRFGNDIWGSGKERPWLLQASEGIAEYPKDLYFGNAADQDVMVYYLRLWILAKAFNTMRKQIQPRAKSIAPTNLDEARQDPQARAHGGSFTVTVDIVAASSGLDAATVPAAKSPYVPMDSATRMRRTSRLPKPRKDLVDIDGETEESTDDSSELGEELENDVPRHYKGKGRAWKKREADEDPVFPSKEHYRSSNRRASDLQSQVTPKWRGRPPKQLGNEARQEVVNLHGSHQELASRAGDGVRSVIERAQTSATPAKMPAKTPAKSTSKLKTEKPLADVDISIGSDSSDQPAINGTSRPRKVHLPLEEDWDEDRWQKFYLQGDGDSLMHATMLLLGLKATPRERDTSSFVVEHYGSLCKDICKIAAKLCKEFSAAELIRSAADPSSLDEEIDIIFDDYSHVWSVDADRTKLLNPGTDTLYSKDLFYEEDDDRKVLWIYLHRWIFMIALMNCKQMHGAGVRNMRKKMDATVPKYILDQWQLGGIYTFDSPEDLGRSENELKAAENISTDPELQESESQLLEAIGGMFADAKTGQHDTATSNAAEPDSGTRRLPRRQQKRKDSSIATPEHQETTRPQKQRRIDRTVSKPDDFTALFMSYLENFAEPRFNELAGLEAIEKELPNVRNYANGLDAKLRARLSPTVFNITLPAWLAYRREIVEAKRKVAAMPPVAQAPSRQVAIMERNRLATQLRIAHENFMDAGYDDLRPEQIIYRAMVTLMNEHGNSQTAEGIRRGLRDMEAEFTGLGDQLMSGGMKYVLSGAASVATLKDLQLHARVGK
ncbi:hypothetical protein E8E12_004651 [Didymella heteroderae]|uniref:Uncharacterized protein n=1 Tax=Didymella heteroderae TaxID=1769908 RepID=A0A9P4WLD1_9PLEO|nr:hypothetical protein E8E12_004651 [Didymella heteroderae]